MELALVHFSIYLCWGILVVEYDAVCIIFHNCCESTEWMGGEMYEMEQKVQHPIPPDADNPLACQINFAQLDLVMLSLNFVQKKINK